MRTRLLSQLLSEHIQAYTTYINLPPEQRTYISQEIELIAAKVEDLNAILQAIQSQ